jgi:hypothetical protein
VDAQRIFKVSRHIEKENGPKSKKMDCTYLRNAGEIAHFLQMKHGILSNVKEALRGGTGLRKQSGLIRFLYQPNSNQPIDQENYLQAKDQPPTIQISQPLVMTEEYRIPVKPNCADLEVKMETEGQDVSNVSCDQQSSSSCFPMSFASSLSSAASLTILASSSPVLNN